MEPLGVRARMVSGTRREAREWCRELGGRAIASLRARTDAFEILRFAARRAQDVRWTRREAMTSCKILAESGLPIVTAERSCVMA